MHSLIKTIALAAAFASATTLAVAEHKHAKIGDLELKQTWTRQTPPAAKVGAAYMIIENSGDADRLISAQSPIAERVEIHMMEMNDGVMKMREMENGLPVEANGATTLEPGGLHLMLMGLKEPIEVDKMVPITITFEKAGTVETEFKVYAIGKVPHGSKAGHGHSHDHNHGHDHSHQGHNHGKTKAE